MKRTQLPIVMLTVVIIVIALGCGDDDDDDSDAGDSMTTIGNSADNVDITGTWKLVSFEPQVAGGGPLPEQIFVIRADGTWAATTVLEVPGLGEFAVAAKGTYRIFANRIVGETTDIEIEPDLGTALAIPAGITGESVVKRDGSKLFITNTDEVTGQTTTTAYEQ